MSRWERHSVEQPDQSPVTKRKTSKPRLVTTNRDSSDSTSTTRVSSNGMQSVTSSLPPWRTFNLEQRPSFSVFKIPPFCGVPHVIFESHLETDKYHEIHVSQEDEQKLNPAQINLEPLFKELDVLLPSQEDVLNYMGLGSQGVPIPLPALFSVIYKPSDDVKTLNTSRHFTVEPSTDDVFDRLLKPNATERCVSISLTQLR